jgi:hypothetical protein
MSGMGLAGGARDPSIETGESQAASVLKDKKDEDAAVMYH